MTMVLNEVEGPDVRQGTAAAVAHGVTLALLLQIRGEFLEMPGMRLTLRQAARLWHLDVATCEAALRHLVAERFLSESAHGAFRRVEA